MTRNRTPQQVRSKVGRPKKYDEWDSRFGGTLRGKGNPRGRRPVSARHSMHVVMRRSAAFKGLSLLRKNLASRIEDQFFSQAKTFGVKIHRYVNVGNHIHVILEPKSGAKELGRFLRGIAGTIALFARKELQRSTKEAPHESFWQARPFSRIVKWGKDFERVKQYVYRNQVEAWGFDRDFVDEILNPNSRKYKFSSA